MSEPDFYRILLGLWLVLPALVLVVLLFIPAPYGRYQAQQGEKTARFRLPGPLGWLLMELPSPVLLGLLYLYGPRPGGAALALLLLWEGHYLHRTVIFPLRRRGRVAPMPVLIVALAGGFNLVNGYLNGRYLGSLGSYPPGWLTGPRFLGGVALFLVGFAINISSDEILRRLRRPGETGYRIPQGGLYRLVSCPNYLGEILEWSGWALAAWSLPALSFALWTFANLVPRAIYHHAYYRRLFPEYPKDRKAVIPFVL